jgi:hypothetical protein
LHFHAFSFNFVIEFITTFYFTIVMHQDPIQQHKVASPESAGPDAEGQGKSLTPPAFQLKASEGPAAPPPAQLKQSSGGMPTDLVQGFAASTGHDLSDVNVVRNSDKPAQVGALAYAQGNDIHLAAGQDQHLAHEAAHIVQQREGRVQANTEVNGKPVNTQQSLESEADTMGAKAMQMKAAHTSEPSAKSNEKAAGGKSAVQMMSAQVIQREPIKRQAGTVDVFLEVFNNTPSKLGQLKGEEASMAMLRLGETEMDWSQLRPVPKTTPYFNNRDGRYIYTTKGGWVDMVHFLFYAGKAYKYKLDKEKARKYREEGEKRMRDALKNGGGYWPPVMPVTEAEKTNPVAESIQDGYQQELSDMAFAKHSAYSYEDLPSDSFGAKFAVWHFNPSSKLTFGEQVKLYMLIELGATEPKDAPNFETMPEKEPTDHPTRTNKSTTPVYTKSNP